LLCDGKNCGTNPAALTLFMKVKSLQICNIGLIVNETINFDKPLLLFYGEVRQGKTTILNAVRYVFGGSFPTDLIRHGEQQAFIQLNFENGDHVRREFYRAGDECKARPVVFVEKGARVARPVDRLKKLLNPFMLDQEHIVRMTELERKKFFADLFQTATDDLDNENARAATQAQELRIKVKAYGDIQPVKVERVNAQQLHADVTSLRLRNTERTKAWQTAKNEVAEHNQSRREAAGVLATWATNIGEIEQRIAELQTRLGEAKGQHTNIKTWLEDPANAEQVTPAEPVLESDVALQQQISDAGAQNVRAENYERDVKRLETKLAEEARVLEIERRQRAIRDEKIARLDKISANCGVPGLKFVDNGEFIFEDTQPGMLSTSQLMRLSQFLSSLYPEGLGLDLVDRAESLGRAVFEFVEKAQREEKTILATIVGERPATVPENIGVFVVSNGKIS
jgi:AAA domain